MGEADVTAVVEFRVDSRERYSKVWKRLDGVQLEQTLRLPEALLAAGNVLELELDGELRSLSADKLRWQGQERVLRFQLRPSERCAKAARRQGMKDWRPWRARQAAAAFLERCRASGWKLRLESAPPPAAKPVVQAPTERKEPTL